jgi:hypothetical protein
MPDSGIDRFCGVCGFSCFTRNWDNPSPPCPDCDVNGPPGKAGKPVTLALGMELSSAVDMVIDGVMPITIGRSYFPWNAFVRNAALASSLGNGWMFSYDWIVYVDPATGEVRLVLPGNARGVTFTPSGPAPMRRRTTCASAARNWSPAGRLAAQVQGRPHLALPADRLRELAHRAARRQRQRAAYRA